MIGFSVHVSFAFRKVGKAEVGLRSRSNEIVNELELKRPENEPTAIVRLGILFRADGTIRARRIKNSSPVRMICPKCLSFPRAIGSALFPVYSKKSAVLYTGRLFVFVSVSNYNGLTYCVYVVKIFKQFDRVLKSKSRITVNPQPRSTYDRKHVNIRPCGL